LLKVLIERVSLKKWQVCRLVFSCGGNILELCGLLVYWNNLPGMA
jgi:hypothetical protein